MIDEQQRSIWILFLTITLTLVTLPFLFVTYVPSADLPQHLSQIKLFLTNVSNQPDSPYTIHYFGANLLVYWMMLVFWWIFPPVLAGKITMFVLALSWVISVFVLARREGRSPVTALLASVVIFNSSLYWGFVNFLSGFPIFIIWYLVVVKRHKEQVTSAHVAAIMIISLFLFFAHSLWLVLAATVLILFDVVKRAGWKNIFSHGGSLIPAMIVAGLWYPKLAATRTTMGFDTAPHWFVLPYERLNPQWIINAVFGGLQGPSEWILLFGILLWIIMSIVTNRKEFWSQVNLDLLIIGGLLMIGVFSMPDKFMNTISFASRWFPVAMIFLLLSLPMPRIPQAVYATAALFLLFTFMVTTAFAWSRFEQNELSGLPDALEMVPENVRVLGLDYVKKSQYIEGRPYIQAFAYAQVLHGGMLNFSFAEHNTGIVVPKSSAAAPKWTPGLEWVAEYVMQEDIQKFDFVLINAQDDLH
ncbi:MAG: hypothetical protein WCW40_08265, partial [Bacteroidota bacterium]